MTLNEIMEKISCSEKYLELAGLPLNQKLYFNKNNLIMGDDIEKSMFIKEIKNSIIEKNSDIILIYLDLTEIKLEYINNESNTMPVFKNYYNYNISNELFSNFVKIIEESFSEFYKKITHLDTKLREYIFNAISEQLNIDLSLRSYELIESEIKKMQRSDRILFYVEICIKIAIYFADIKQEEVILFIDMPTKRLNTSDLNNIVKKIKMVNYKYLFIASNDTILKKQFLPGEIINFPVNNNKNLFLKNMNSDEIIRKLNHDDSFFKKKGIHGIKNQCLQKNNLIMGENGAGKSRFLKTIKEYVEKEVPENEKKKPILLYLDFTEIRSEYSDGNMFDDTIVFDVFIKGYGPNKIFKNLVKIIETSFNEFCNQLTEIDRRLQNFILEGINEQLINSLKRQLNTDISNGWEISEREKQDFIPLDSEIKRMSPGERALLFFAIGIEIIKYYTKDKDKEVIILIDEPETHLHPDALLNVIRQIKKLNYEYLFIASHSVFLIPDFEFEELIHISNGQINRMCSKTYRKLYGDLIGDTNNGNRSLFDFLGSEFEWEYICYLSECFLFPKNIDDSNPKDKQANILRQFIQDKVLKIDSGTEKQLIKVLDYGAGSGRIGRCICEKISLDPEDEINKAFKEMISYSVYDIDEIDQENVNKEKICILDGIFNKNKLSNCKEEFDILILFNVLHEIDVKEWKNEVKKILSLVKDDGYIVFSERRVLSKGEDPYGESGYLVLNEDEIKSLFGSSKIEKLQIATDIATDTVENNTVLCCALCKKDCSQEIENLNITYTLNLLLERVKNRIYETIGRKANSEARRLVKNEVYTYGREYAFYCQQYFNVKHALSILNNINPIKNNIISFYDYLESKNNIDELLARVLSKNKIVNFSMMDEVSREKFLQNEFPVDYINYIQKYLSGNLK